MTSASTYVVVTGFDYILSKRMRGTSFSDFGKRRIKQLVGRNKNSTNLIFLHFDFASGQLITYQYSKADSKPSITPERLRDPIRMSDYEKDGPHGEQTIYRLKQEIENKLSIVDVYKAIQNIGLNVPGSVRELNIFSHADPAGPILLNSYDRSSSAARDPHDYDPRFKDFLPPNMNADQKLLLQKAFSSDARGWIWGCAFDAEVNNILVKTFNAIGQRTVSNDDTIELKNLDKDAFAQLEAYLKREEGLSLSKTKTVLRFGSLKSFICSQLHKGFSYHLAHNLQIPVFAGLVGTYSIYEPGLNLMRVEPNTFKRHFEFYKKYFQFELDPEDRKYAKYTPNFVC